MGIGSAQAADMVAAFPNAFAGANVTGTPAGVKGQSQVGSPATSYNFTGLEGYGMGGPFVSGPYNDPAALAASRAVFGGDARDLAAYNSPWTAGDQARAIAQGGPPSDPGIGQVIVSRGDPNSGALPSYPGEGQLLYPGPGFRLTGDPTFRTGQGPAAVGGNTLDSFMPQNLQRGGGVGGGSDTSGSAVLPGTQQSWLDQLAQYYNQTPGGAGSLANRVDGGQDVGPQRFGRGD